MRIQSPLEIRFFAKINFDGPVPDRFPELGPCWDWMGSRTTAGYGHIRENGDLIYAHRLAWQIYKGPIPDGKWILHRCDRPCCVAERHIFVGTAKENSWDARDKGRLQKQAETLKRLWREKWNVTQRGENNPGHKLSSETVLEIRRTYQKGVVGFKTIRKRFGISFGLAQRIIYGKTWKHLTDQATPPATGDAAQSE